MNNTIGNRLHRFLCDNKIALLLIILLGTLLRFLYIDLQSPWMDEVITLKVTSVNSSYDTVIDRMQSGNQHLPLYYVLLHTIHLIFGDSILVARLFSAVFGVLGIGAMYLLGKQLSSKSLGLIVAMLTAVNFFHIRFSQEARMYSMLFLGTVISTIFLIKLLKNPTKKNAIYWGISLGLFANIHLFALFNILALGIVYILAVIKAKSKKLFFRGLLSLVIFIILSIPVIYVVFNTTVGNDSWIPAPSDELLYKLFRNFFGSESAFYLILLFISFATYLFMQKKTRVKPIAQLNIGFILLLLILIPFLVVLFISIYYMPIIQPRYLIGVLPALLLIIAFGIKAINTTALKYISIGVFVYMSLYILIEDRSYYKTIYKTQFRETADYIKNKTLQNTDVAIVSNLAWYYSYFLDKESYAIQQGTIDTYVDEISKNKNQVIPEFWYVSAHGDHFNPSPETEAYLLENYILSDGVDMVDAYAKKYVHQSIYKPDIDTKSIDFSQSNSGAPVKFYIEDYKTTPQNMQLKGWCFIENSQSVNTNIFLLMVRDNVAQYVYPVNKKIRPDIENAFSSPFDLSYAGVNLVLPIEEIDEGSYALYLYLVNDTSKGAVAIDKVLIR